MHVYRWDLDKTYLQTDFDSIRGLVRSATEPASAKRAVPGATQLMRALCSKPDARVYILSGSPTQMRDVLEEKLRLDGVRFEQLVLKDHVTHLRKGRMRAIRGQFGYKLPVLLQTRAGMGRGASETLFGDDAEIDALVYSVYGDAVAGRLGAAAVSRIMEAAGAYPDRIEAALAALPNVATADAVQRIFIRLERRVPPERFATLGRRVIPIYSWWQAAVVLFGAGHISARAAGDVLEAVLARSDDDAETRAFAVAGLTQDIVRRRHASADVLEAIEGPPDVLARCREAVARMGAPRTAIPPSPPGDVDYLSLLRSWSARRG